MSATPAKWLHRFRFPRNRLKCQLRPSKTILSASLPRWYSEAYEIPALSTRLRRRIPRSSYNNNRSTTTEAHISWTDAAWRAFCLYKSSLVHHHRITPSIKIERTGAEYSAFSVNQAYLCSRRASTPPCEPPPRRQESAWSAILFTCRVISKSGRITNKHNEDEENQEEENDDDDNEERRRRRRRVGGGDADARKGLQERGASRRSRVAARRTMRTAATREKDER